jgi:hypothetical protein
MKIVEYCMKRILGMLTVTQAILFLIGMIAIVALFRWLSGSQGTYSKTVVSPPKPPSPRSRLLGGSPPSNRACSKGEAECRRVLEDIFKKPFPNRRPEFMKNTVTGAKLELDCFNAEEKLAVEYHGIQHYKFVPRFHKDKQAFYNQVYRDKETRDLCKKNGIRLIEVSYKTPIHEIGDYIKRKLRE